MDHATAVCRIAGRTNCGPRNTSHGSASAGVDEEGWQVVRRRNGSVGMRAPTTGTGRRPSRPPQQLAARGASQPRQIVGGSRPRSISCPPPGRVNAEETHPTQEANKGNAEQHQRGTTGRVWGAIPKGITNNHSYIPLPPPRSELKFYQADPMIEEGLYNTQPLPLRPNPNVHVASTEDDGNESGSDDTSIFESHRVILRTRTSRVRPKGKKMRPRVTTPNTPRITRLV